MKRAITGFLTALSIVVVAVCAWAEGPPVEVKHTLTSYSKADRMVTLEYSVQVRNLAENPLPSLALTLIPRPPVVTTKSTVNLSTLAPRESTTFTVKFATRLLQDQAYFSKRPLLWAGKYQDEKGKLVEFPVKSKPGGAK